MIRGMTSAHELPLAWLFTRIRCAIKVIGLKKKLTLLLLLYWRKMQHYQPCTLTALLFRSYLNVDSLDDTGDDMEHLHFCVALRYLLQQLEEEPKYGLQVLQGGSWSLEIGRTMLSFSDVSACQSKSIYSSFGIDKNVLTGRNCSVRNSKSSTGGGWVKQEMHFKNGKLSFCINWEWQSFIK